MRQKISARVDGGTSGPSSVRRRGARTPIGASGNFIINYQMDNRLNIPVNKTELELKSTAVDYICSCMLQLMQLFVRNFIV